MKKKINRTIPGSSFPKKKIAATKKTAKKPASKRFKVIAIVAGFIILAALALVISLYETRPSQYKDTLYIEDGIASWYGHYFHGRQTTSGEKFSMYEFTAAHRKLPFGTWVTVINKRNNKKIKVKITDRGPVPEDRIIDLSRAAAKELGMMDDGLADVKLLILNKDINPE